MPPDNFKGSEDISQKLLEKKVSPEEKRVHINKSIGNIEQVLNGKILGQNEKKELSNLDFLIENGITTKEEIRFLYKNADKETKKELLLIDSKEEFELFKENNQELLSGRLITKGEIEEQVYLNDGKDVKDSKDGSIDNKVNELFVELLGRDDSIKLKKSLGQEFINSLEENLEGMPAGKQKFIITLISQYGVNEKNGEADKYFKDLGYKFKGDKASWCAAIINWSLQKSGVDTIQKTLSKEKANFKGYDNEYVNIRAMAFANGKGKAHVAVLIGKDKDGNNIFMGGNQSKSSDERIEGRKGSNKGEVTIRKDQYAKNILGYREILENGTLSKFKKETNSKNIPMYSIVTFGRGNGKNH